MMRQLYFSEEKTMVSQFKKNIFEKPLLDDRFSYSRLLYQFLKRVKQ